METIPTTSRSLDHYYHINGDTFEKQYKEVLSGYREWSELSHAKDWLVFPENIGESICIDETAPSNGELYTIVSNRTSHGGKGTIIAIVKGVAADVVTEVLMRIDEDKRLTVKEITMDMSNSMRLIARRCFPNAMRTIDRFHIQKLACDALQEMRIAHRWDAIQADTDAREEAKCLGEAYTPIVLANGDTHKQLLARSRYLLFKSVHLNQGFFLRLRSRPMSPLFPRGISLPVPKFCQRPYSRKDWLSPNSINRPSALTGSDLGLCSKRPVSITPRSVICSRHILSIVSLKARTNFCLCSNICCSVIC